MNFLKIQSTSWTVAFVREVARLLATPTVVTGGGLTWNEATLTSLSRVPFNTLTPGKILSRTHII